MESTTLLLALAIAASMATCGAVTMEELETLATSLQAAINNLQKTDSLIVRELRENQYRADEMTRSSGASGLKTIKGRLAPGTKAYYRTSFSGANVGSIHDHADHFKTTGMGEFIYVMNGVEGRTRHNDFMLRSKSLTTSDFGATTDLDYPDVPPEVTSQPTVEAQITEMKEWFAAFQDQAHGVRDYRPYFPPVLCYLEGTWVPSTAPNDTIEEIFISDRHSLNAATWAELEDRINFSAFTGRDDDQEELAYFPQRFLGQDENGVPIVARWTYRILCHKLNTDLPLNRFRTIDDIKSRMALSSYLNKAASMLDLSDSRLARFQINTENSLFFDEDSGSRHTLLDDLMEQIPGMNNYNANLTDDAFGINAYDFVDPSQLQNAAYYHRSFQVSENGAMGTRTRGRTFNDPFVYIAMTTHLEVAAAHFENDQFNLTQRWSYAIPLEILYLTPLGNWNPYNITFHGWKGDPGTEVVEAGGRNGKSAEKPYRGTHSKTFFRTPIEFFGNETDPNTDPADTSRGLVYVEDASGVVREVGASGARIMYAIPEVTRPVRTRYPIVSIYEEGSATWMETKALSDILLQPTKFATMSREYEAPINESTPCTTYNEPLSYGNAEDTVISNLEVQMSAGTFIDVTFYLYNLDETHTEQHQLVVSADNMMTLCRNHEAHVALTTSTADGHSHAVSLFKTVYITSGDTYRIKYVLSHADGVHPNTLGLDRRVYFMSQ